MDQAAAQLPKKGVGVLRMTKRQQDQAQAGRPSLDLTFQNSQRIIVHGATQRRREQIGGLGRREPQILEPDLGDPTTGAQAGDSKRRLWRVMMFSRRGRGGVPKADP